MTTNAFAPFRNYGGTVPVWLDYMGEDHDEYAPELALWAVRLESPWNGWAVPVVTGDEFRRWVAALSVDDPNGSWGTVHEGDGALILRSDDRDDDVWTVSGLVDGVPVYAIEGWTLVTA